MKNLYRSLFFLLAISYSAYCQEGFNIEFGQFFEQGYGGALDEEGMDLAPFNTDKLLVGWQQTSDGESGIKDASIWHLSEKGQEQYQKLIGNPEFDEVATGVVQVSPETYAVCVHQSMAWSPREVKSGDQTWIYLIQSGGTILWTYNYQGSEEEGTAPSDILLDRNGTIAVLINKLSSSGGIVNEVLNLSTSGQLNWVSPTFIRSQLGGWAFEMLETNNGYVSILNDQVFHYPIAFELSKNGGSLNQLEHYSANIGDQLFGLDYDSASQTIVAAGFTVYENDTDALVLNMDQGLQKLGQWNYGILGTEKLIDIVAKGDGFVAGGQRSNKGEGKFDCYILHLNSQFNIYAEETYGGSTSERLNNINFMAGRRDVWFAGHNIEWSIAESGNAYLGGTTLGWSLNGTACEIPRVMWLDGLLKPSGSTYISGYSIGNSTTNTATLNNLARLNTNTIVLYDIDKLLVALDNGTVSQNSTLVNQIEDFLDQAAANPYNFTIGIVMGPGLNKLNLTNEWMSALNGVSYWNYTKPLKLNFMVLEHEFWNLQFNSDFRLLDQAAWVNKNLIKNQQTGLPANANIATYTGSPSPTLTIKNLYFHQAVSDHHHLLDQLFLEASSSANNWKVIDYIYAFCNRTPSSNWGATPQHYGYINLNNASFNIASAAITIDQHRALLAEYSKVKSDAIFLVYTRSAQLVADYDLATSSRPWVKRLVALMDRQPLMQANIIPLLYSENGTCQIGYDEYGNPNTNSNPFLGTWLGGNNNLKLAESYYMADHTVNFYNAVGSTCPTCISDIKITGLSWYTFNCILDAESSNGTLNAATNGRIACGSVGGYISEQEQKDRMFNLSVFPNPSNSWVTFEGVERYSEVQVYNQLGQLVMQSKLDASLNLDLSNLNAGMYSVFFPSLGEGLKVLLISK